MLGFARIVGTTEHSDDEWFTGPIGILLDDVVAYPEPVTIRGAQGYWSVLEALTEDDRVHWDERVAIRSQHGEMSAECAHWWALHDVLRKGAQP